MVIKIFSWLWYFYMLTVMILDLNYFCSTSTWSLSYCTALPLFVTNERRYIESVCNVANSKVTTGNARIAYHSFRFILKRYCSFSLMIPNFAFYRSPMLKRPLGKESRRGWEWMQTHKCIPYWHRHKEATHCLNCRQQRHIHTTAQK